MAKFVLYRTLGKRDKDPVIAKVKAVLAAEGILNKPTLLHDISGNATSTFKGWFDGDTLSPQHKTIMRAVTAAGYDIEFVKRREVDFDKEREIAKEFFAERAKTEGKQKRGKRRKNRRLTPLFARAKANGHAHP